MGFLGAIQGQRQFHLVSPWLFIMVEKVLRKSFSNLASSGAIAWVKADTSLPLKIIFKNVDDTFLFGLSLVIEIKAW